MVIVSFAGFCLYFIVLQSIFVHEKGLQSEKVHTKMSDSLPHNTLCGWWSGLYFHNLCASLSNRRYRNIYMFIYIIKYILLYRSNGFQLKLFFWITLPYLAWPSLLCLWLATYCLLSNAHVQLSPKIEKRQYVSLCSFSVGWKGFNIQWIYIWLFKFKYSFFHHKAAMKMRNGPEKRPRKHKQPAKANCAHCQCGKAMVCLFVHASLWFTLAWHKITQFKWGQMDCFCCLKYILFWWRCEITKPSYQPPYIPEPAGLVICYSIYWWNLTNLS